MKRRKLVLINPEVYGEPLFLEFEDEVPVGNRDEIVCEISLKQASQMLEHYDGTYFEDNINIPLDVILYIKKMRKDDEGKE